MRLTSTMLFAVFAFGGAMAASNVSVAHPLFLTESGKELLFSGTNPAGTTATLRALNLGILETLSCEKVLVDGFASPKSPLAHRVEVGYHGKCEQTISTSKSTCIEPIVWKTSLAELGLVSGNKTVGILLAPGDGTSGFAEVSCGGQKTTYEGAIVGEIPVINRNLETQYNKPVSDLEQVFEAVGKDSESQNLTSIELLGVNMTGAELKVSGVFGGKGSQEMTLLLKGDGKIEICIRADSACP